MKEYSKPKVKILDFTELMVRNVPATNIPVPHLPWTDDAQSCY